MKTPARFFLPVLFSCGLLLCPLIEGQEAPTRGGSSKEAAKPPKKAIKATVTSKVEVTKDLKKAEPKKSPPRMPPAVLIVFEFIEVDHEQFSDWVFDNTLKTDGTEFRKEVQRWVKEDDAEIIKTAVINARSGQRAKAESIKEFIYPTEYDPPETANEPNLSDSTEAPVIPATSTAFETRNLGTTIEVDPVLSDDGNLIDLNLSPEMVFHLDNVEWITESNGEEQIVSMPIIYAMKATTQIVVRNGGYAFVSTLELPPEDDDDDDDDDRIVLLFVRADSE